MNINDPKYDVSDDGARLLLFEFGIEEKTLLTAPILREGKVRFLAGNTFEFTDEEDGIRALIFIEPNDELIAWRPGLSIASFHGRSYALNEHALCNPATWFDDGKLRIHRTPLEWLKADRNGIVIVQPAFTYYELRRAAERGLSFADQLHKQQVKRWLEPPKVNAKIFMEIVDARGAA
jgi:hypothetical protein